MQGKFLFDGIQMFKVLLWRFNPSGRNATREDEWKSMLTFDSVFRPLQHFTRQAEMLPPVLVRPCSKFIKSSGPGSMWAKSWFIESFVSFASLEVHKTSSSQESFVGETELFLWNVGKARYLALFIEIPFDSYEMITYLVRFIYSNKSHKVL